MPSPRPPLLTSDPATGRVYVVTDYGHRGGELVAYERTDVTEAFVAILRWYAETGRFHV